VATIDKTIDKPLTVDTPVTTEELETLKQPWGTAPGVVGWFMTVNHRSIGMRFIVTAFIFFLLGGIEALLMRMQLAQSNLDVLSAEAYNQFFTMHGTTMMFLFAVPMVEGLGIYLVPLMIGTRDMSFPRLSAFGYYIFLLAGVTLYAGFFFGRAPDAGWFNYPPLSGPIYSPGLGISLWSTMITFLEISALTAAVELIVTIFKQRAPGMSLNRMPIFVWSILVMAFMIVFAMPPLVAASVMLALDRVIGTYFYNPLQGGNPLLWEHLFWWFGHPEVYIILLPALGAVSMIVATFTRRPVFGYTFVVLATVSIGILSFGLWVHHMFAVGLPLLGMSFFAAASMTIAIPSGVQIFAWIATMWSGRLVLKTPLLYVIGFIIIFVLGGITGVMVAAVPFDWQVHDSFFVVAHFHYVLIGGVVFPILGGLHYWFPKFSGRMPSESLGKLSFFLTFIGFNVTFFPMHILGFWGMPRRVYTYLPGLGWDGLNLLATVGAFLLAFGILVFIWNLFWSFLRGEQAGDNPWDADTLEWATSSPPPGYNFPVIPAVHSREPLWNKPPETTTTQEDQEPEQCPPFGLLTQRREALGTSPFDAMPQMRIVLPRPTIVPFFTALAVGFTALALLIHMWVVLIGMVLTTIMLGVWLWPPAEEQTMEYATAGPPDALPTDKTILSQNIYPPFMWGIVGLLLIEATVFSSFIVSYFYLRLSNPVWPPPGIQPPTDLIVPGLAMLALIASAVPIYWSGRRLSEHGDQKALRWGYIIADILAATFLVLRLIEISRLDFSWDTHVYGSIYWTMLGLHTIHGFSLVISSLGVTVLVFKGYFNKERQTGVLIDAVYWYFVVAVWVPAGATLYLTPHLL
jgi:cytochrome c oxidase subunit I+III